MLPINRMPSGRWLESFRSRRNSSQQIGELEQPPKKWGSSTHAAPSVLAKGPRMRSRSVERGAEPRSSLHVIHEQDRRFSDSRQEMQKGRRFTDVEVQELNGGASNEGRQGMLSGCPGDDSKQDMLDGWPTNVLEDVVASLSGAARGRGGEETEEVVQMTVMTNMLYSKARDIMLNSRVAGIASSKQGDVAVKKPAAVRDSKAQGVMLSSRARAIELSKQDDAADKIQAAAQDIHTWRLAMRNTRAVESASAKGEVAVCAELSKQEDAAVKMQAAMRGAKARQEDAAVKIQAAMQGAKAREEDAVVKIQAVMRGAKAREVARNARAENVELSKKAGAAILIQAAVRGFLERRSFRRLKAIVRVQAVVRGFLVRRQAALTFQRLNTLLRAQERACLNRVALNSDSDSKFQKRIRTARKAEVPWCSNVGSADDVNAKLKAKQEAIKRRERARLYAEQQGARLGGKHESWNWLESWMGGGSSAQTSQGGGRASGSLHGTFIDVPGSVVRPSPASPVARPKSSISGGSRSSSIKTKDSPGASSSSSTSSSQKRTSAVGARQPSFMASTVSAEAKRILFNDGTNVPSMGLHLRNSNSITSTRGMRQSCSGSDWQRQSHHANSLQV